MVFTCWTLALALVVASPSEVVHNPFGALCVPEEHLFTKLAPMINQTGALLGNSTVEKSPARDLETIVPACVDSRTWGLWVLGCVTSGPLWPISLFSLFWVWPVDPAFLDSFLAPISGSHFRLSSHWSFCLSILLVTLSEFLGQIRTQGRGSWALTSADFMPRALAYAKKYLSLVQLSWSIGPSVFSVSLCRPESAHPRFSEELQGHLVPPGVTGVGEVTNRHSIYSSGAALFLFISPYD